MRVGVGVGVDAVLWRAGSGSGALVAGAVGDGVWRPLCFGLSVRAPASGRLVAFVYRGTGRVVLAVGGCGALGQPAAVWVLPCVVVAVWAGALGALVAWLDVGVPVGVLLVLPLLRVVGWTLFCAGLFCVGW